MTLLNEIKKGLAKHEQSVAQKSSPVVPNVTANVSAKVAKKEQTVKMSDIDAIVAAKVAEILAQKSATQKAAPTVAAEVELTHVIEYQAGINKRTGKAYQASAKFHAKPLPKGSNSFGGLSADDAGQILLNYPKSDDFYTDLTAFFEKYGKNSKIYKVATEEVIQL